MRPKLPKLPKLVMSSNPMADKEDDVTFAIKSGFDGVDWSFARDRVPLGTRSKTRFISQVRRLHDHDIEVRFHTPFLNTEIGHRDDKIAQWAMDLHCHTLELMAEAGGEFLTLHIGLGSVPDEEISRTKVHENLTALKAFGLSHGVTISLENLMHGPTSFPEEWIEILEQVDIHATFDFGHAKGCPAVVKGLWAPIEMVYQVKERLNHAHIYKEENGEGHIPPETINDLGTDLLDALLETSCRWWVIELAEKKAALHTKDLLETYIQTS